MKEVAGGEKKEEAKNEVARGVKDAVSRAREAAVKAKESAEEAKRVAGIVNNEE